jgi:hypothetical protein
VTAFVWVTDDERLALMRPSALRDGGI